MDFSDATFKAYTSCVTPKGTMVERDSTNYPGVYDFLMGTTGLSGLYQEFAESYGADNYFSENPVRFQDGTEYLGGLTVSENTQIFALPTAAANAAALLAAATTTPIAANMEQTHGTQLKGDGTAADKFRSTLVP